MLRLLRKKKAEVVLMAGIKHMRMKVSYVILRHGQLTIIEDQTITGEEMVSLQREGVSFLSIENLSEEE